MKNKITSTIILNNIFSRIVYCIIFFFVFIVDAKAQPSPSVNANLIIAPPYSVYFRDYAGYGKINNMLLSLFSTTNRRVYLAGSVTKDDNSIIISVKNAYRPLSPILLTANTPMMLNGLQLRKIYGDGTTNDLNLTGLTANDIGLNQALPEGSYTFCIQVKDYDTREILSTACKTIFVTYYDPPQIINPVNGMAVQGFNPQMLMVTWQNTAPQVFGITYRLKIVKLINGVTSLDAINNNVQLILDKGNLFTTNYPLDVSSGIKLDPGQVYAMQVIAQSSTAYFKNNGKSEVTTFYYKGPNYFDTNNVKLNFLNPVAEKGRDTIEVNSENPFVLSWNLFEGNSSEQKNIVLDSATNKKYGVVKYVVKITPALNPSAKKPTDKNFNLLTSVTPDANNILHSNIIYKEDSADKAGFKENYWYNATVNAYDKNGQLVVKNSSVDFLYKKLKDDELYTNTSVHAVIKYSFKGFAEQYNAANTPVEIEALQKVNAATNKPIIKIGNVDYISLAKASANTQSNGEVQVNVPVPVTEITSDSLYYRVALKGAYYIDKDFKLLSAKVLTKNHRTNKDTSYINFGQLVAKTYGYSLKVNVSKVFPSYRISSKNGSFDIKLMQYNSFGKDYESTDSGMVYKLGFAKAAAGITIVLYRKTKQTYIPPVEGNIEPTDASKYGDVEVARGITTISTDGKGHDTSFVKFDRLLSNIFNGDEYYIVALSPVITITQSVPQLMGGRGGNYTRFDNINPYFNKVYKDSGFVATEAVFKLPKPVNINREDSLYRSVSFNYEITSIKPPTSLIKGRLLYQWKSDNSHQVRPLANSKFKIVVDYLVKGKSIGYATKFVNKTFEEKFFVPEGGQTSDDGMQLLDFGQTMATGTTDAQGNFEIDVVNLNPKGSLGKGYVVSKGWTVPDEKGLVNGIKGPGDVIKNKMDAIFDPGNRSFGIYGSDLGGGVVAIQQSLTQNANEQGFLNQGMTIVMDKTGSFNVTSLGKGIALQNTQGLQKSLHGPNPGFNNEDDPNSYQNDNELVDFQRVYRIVPDNQFYYPTKDVAVVQPFEAIAGNTYNSFVKEVKVKVSTKENINNTLDGMKVIIFRSLADKTKDLPAGEGDGKYLQKELINPQYKSNVNGLQIANLADKNNLLSTKFEHLALVNDNTSDVQNANLPDKNNMFNTKFEYLWPAADVNSNGETAFTTLLAGYENYYVEASSNPDMPGKYYKATFQAFSTDINDNNPDFWDGTASPDPINVTVTLQPLPSRAFLRLIDATTQISIPNGKIRVYDPKPLGFGAVSKTVFADQDGYAELKVSDDPLSNYVLKNGTTINFSGEAAGYIPSKYGTEQFTFNLQGNQFADKISLTPAGKIMGHLVSADEKVSGYIKAASGQFAFELNNSHQSVEGYIKTASGKIFSTDKNGYFEIPTPVLTGNTIEIIPKDVAYFDTSYTMNFSDVIKKTVDLKDIQVYRRKHRIRFIITDAENGGAVDNATIELDNISKKTQKGIAEFLFENVSVNNYTFIIHGPDGKNYIPITKNVKNEESKDFVTLNVSIERGSEISGTVTLDGKPVQHARVYIDADAEQQPAAGTPKPQGKITDDANLLQAFTDASGNYTLHGVPVNNQKIDLLATLDTSFAVSGDRQKADVTNKEATANFSLTGYKDLVINNLDGFPLTVEKITPTSNADEVKVTGLVHWTESVSNFSLNAINTVIRVENVLYKSVASVKGKVGVAQDDVVTLEGTSSLKLKYLDKYNVLLKSPDLFTPKPLTITKENDYGAIKGMIQIVDNSFNYPSSYLNFNSESFWFAQKNNDSINNVLSAVKSAIKISEASSGNYRTINDIDKKVAEVKANYAVENAGTPDYFLSNNSGGNLQFSFIGFNANADAKNSFIDKQGKIHLSISMNCTIKNAEPENFSVKLSDVVLDENKVYPASNSSPIEVALEDWKLSIKNWKISPEEGGITSNDGLIKTAKLDIPFSTFLLRSDMFDIDNFKVTELKLGGGIVPLSDIKVSGPGNPGLVFDNKTGSDMKPHWRFSLSGTGTPVAKIKNLPGLNGEIGINYIQILSNNENIFQLQQTNTTLLINNNQLAKFSPQIISNGPDYFNITGALNVNAPRMSDMSLELNYTLQNNALAMKLRNVKTEFEGKGFVHFTAVEQDNDKSNITIDNNTIIINGEVEEKPNKSFNPVPATFTASSGASPGYKVELPKDYVMQLTSETKGSSSSGYKLTIAKGGMEVSNGDWGTLSYEGMMASNSPSDKGIKNTYTKFNILGDVSVSADKVEMDNTTPFGKLTMIFDFPAKRLIGKLDLDHVQMGTNTITGTVETLFDPAGFYVAGGGKADINIGNPIADGTYNLGFMIGSYPLKSASDELWKVVTAYKQPEVKNDCFVQKLNGKLAGFYMSVDRLIFDVDYDFDFVIVSGYVNGKALVGVDMWANFSGETTLGVAVKVYAHAAAGMSAITGTSLSGEITALAALKLAYENSKFVVQGSIDMSFAVSIRQDLIATTISASTSVGCSAQGGTEGFSFELNSGKPINACY